MSDFWRRLRQHLFRETEQATGREHLRAVNDKIVIDRLKQAVTRLYDDNSRLHAELQLVRGANLLLHDKIEQLEGTDPHPLAPAPRRPPADRGNPHNTSLGVERPVYLAPDVLGVRALLAGRPSSADYYRAGLNAESNLHLDHAELVEELTGQAVSIVDTIVDSAEAIGQRIAAAPSPLVQQAEARQRVEMLRLVATTFDVPVDLLSD